MADISTMQDLLKLQQEMKDRLVKKLEPTTLGKAAALKGFMADKAVDIGRAQEALDNAMKERDTVGKYWDERIARLRARVDTLAKDMKRGEEQVKLATRDAKADTPATKEDVKPDNPATKEDNKTGPGPRKRPPRDV